MWPVTSTSGPDDAAPTSADEPAEFQELPSPGREAIDTAMARLYGQARPRHVGYVPPAAFSTNLQGCSAYAAADHWHYVTYGLSELYVPDEAGDPEFSGWGFEFTLRVPRSPDDADPPGWPFTMINELAKHVNGNSVLIETGDRVDMRAPVTGYPHLPDAPPTGLTVYAFIIDPELGRIDTPNGQVSFLQAVGVTAEEKERMLSTSTAVVLDDLALTNPRLLTDPGRA
jgi:hypothetical protein